MNFHCPHCLRTFDAPADVAVLFHRCPVRSRAPMPRIRAIPSREEHRAELWHALVAAQGPESIWRPLDEAGS